MKKTLHCCIGLGIAGTILLAGTSQVMAASVSQMKVCKIAILNQPQLHDFPMAAISVRPGKKPNRVAYTLRWEGASGHGYCRVTPEGDVREIKLKSFHRGGGGGNNLDSGGHVEQDGFWRDDRGRWIDPSGEVCHTCTPENGFPAAEGGDSAGSVEIDGFYYDRHIGQWRDPDGEICHSCTPENGFPDQ